MLGLRLGSPMLLPLIKPWSVLYSGADSSDSVKFTFNASAPGEYLAVGIMVSDLDLAGNQLSVELGSLTDPTIVVKRTEAPYGVAICPSQFVAVRCSRILSFISNAISRAVTTYQ